MKVDVGCYLVPVDGQWGRGLHHQPVQLGVQLARVQQRLPVVVKRVVVAARQVGGIGLAGHFSPGGQDLKEKCWKGNWDS